MLARAREVPPSRPPLLALTREPEARSFCRLRSRDNCTGEVPVVLHVRDDRTNGVGAIARVRVCSQRPVRSCLDSAHFRRRQVGSILRSALDSPFAFDIDGEFPLGGRARPRAIRDTRRFRTGCVADTLHILNY